MSKRIQCQRTNGWRMPEGTVYVGRPSKWGSPFFIGSNLPDVFVHDGVVVLWATPRSASALTEARREAVRRFREWFYAWVNIPGWGGHIDELRGKDLACWCPLVDENGDKVPCHADVLLEWANGEESGLRGPDGEDL